MQHKALSLMQFQKNFLHIESKIAGRICLEVMMRGFQGHP